MANLLIMGPPGAGKGTQAKLIAEKIQIPTISTGAILRDNIAAGSQLGKQAAQYIEDGHYVPDELVDKIVTERLQQSDTYSGFLLDGYPRTFLQTQYLDTLIEKLARPLQAVISLTVDKEAVVQRILKRATVEGRADDTEPVIRHRLEVYDSETKPLLDFYRSRNLLLEVNGLGDISEVTKRVFAAIIDRISL